MLPTVVAIAGLVSIVFTVRGLMTHWWVLLWIAALCSFVVSFFGLYSIGGAVFLLTCLQLSAVVLLGAATDRNTTAVILLASVAIWAAVVPVQVYGPQWLGGYSVYLLVGLLGLLVSPLLRVARRRGPA